MTEIIARAAIMMEGVVWSVPRPMRHHHAIHLYRYGDMEPGMPADRDVLRTGFIGAAAQGFLTSADRFVSREEAWHIALAAGQIVQRVGGDEGRLFSENLW